jgi:hypothetical protein
VALPKLLDQASPARTEAGFSLTSGAYPWPDAGERVIFVTGTFDNARVQAEVSPDAVTWFPHEDPLFETGCIEAELQPGAYIRLRITGGSDATRITAWV